MKRWLLALVLILPWAPGRVEATAPTVVLTRPAAGRVAGTVTLDVSVTGSATEVRYYANGGQIGADFTSPSWDETWDSRTIPDGVYALSATARNSAGELGTSEPVTITVDNVPDTTTTTTTTTLPETTTTATTTTTLPETTTTTAPPVSGACPSGWYLAESQSWWWQPSFGGDEEFNARHLHTEGCVPHRDTVLSGVVPFKITVKMHHNPGRVYYVAIVVKTDSIERSFSVNPGWTCPTMDCTFSHTFNLDMAQYDKAGLQEVRFRASDRQPDLGTEIHSSINSQFIVANGKTVNPIDRYPFLRGKGWYTDHEYCEADVRTDLASSQIPKSPVSGTWTPILRQVDHDDSTPISRHTVRVDPNIHGGHRGTFLVDGIGEREGPLAIDTTQLANGPHKLMIHSECRGSDGVNSGILVVPFVVAN